MNRIAHPSTVLIAFAVLCLLAFWASIPLPRADNQLVGSDGINYYAYLPTLAFDRDLDFRNQWQSLLAYSQDEITARTAGVADGQPIGNPHPIGTAIFWMPFFLFASGAAHLLRLLGAGVSIDGHGHFFQAIVLSGSIIYGGFGLWFTYRFVSRFTTVQGALAATLIVAAAGNVIYYMTAEPSMSHNVSLFLGALFFLVWARFRDDDGLRVALLYGALGGAMALVRPQDGLFLLLPYISQIPAVWHGVRNHRYRTAYRWIRNGLMSATVAFVVFSPQFIAWGVMFGRPFHSPYSDAGDFYWLQPKLWHALMSAHRGLFVWHPVFLLALAGLIFTYRKDKAIAMVCAIGFVMQWYLIGSWSWWWQGGAFGSRMMIVCTPIFALGLASLVDFIAARWSWKPVYAAAALLLLWNFLLYVEYRFWLVYVETAREPTWHDVTLGRITYLMNRLF